LKAIALDHPFDAARADGELALAEPLGDHGGRGFGVEEPVADDLADGLVGPAVVRLGSALLALEARRSLGRVDLEELVIAPLGQAELRCGSDGSEFRAMPLEKHGEPPGDVVAGRDRESAGGSDEHRIRSDDIEHDRSSCLRGPRSCERRRPPERSIPGTGG
jgi:hypothetical protein